MKNTQKQQLCLTVLKTYHFKVPKSVQTWDEYWEWAFPLWDTVKLLHHLEWLQYLEGKHWSIPSKYLGCYAYHHLTWVRGTENFFVAAKGWVDEPIRNFRPLESAPKSSWVFFAIWLRCWTKISERLCLKLEQQPNIWVSFDVPIAGMEFRSGVVWL